MAGVRPVTTRPAKRVSRTLVRQEAMRLLRETLGMDRAGDARVLSKAVAVIRVYHQAEVNKGVVPVGFRP